MRERERERERERASERERERERESEFRGIGFGQDLGREMVSSPSLQKKNHAIAVSSLLTSPNPRPMNPKPV